MSKKGRWRFFLTQILKKMKKIHVKSIFKNNKIYTVHLGNGTAHEFPSMRKANAFLNKTSQFLTQCLYETSELYRNTWNAYQDVWFLFSNHKGSENMIALDNECKDAFQIIERIREYLVRRVDNHAAFGKFEFLFAEIKRVLKILTSIHKRRSNTPAIYRLHALYREAMRLERSIIEYCEEDAGFLIDIKKKMPVKRHFSQNGTGQHVDLIET